MPSKRNNSIEDNGYAPVTLTNWVHVGALVVYRDATRTVKHVGIVREVLIAGGTDGTKSTTYCNYGTPTLVEGKWGAWGRYKHPPEIVPYSYLPPDDPDTPEREGIQYYALPFPLPHKRQPPPGSIDPGKDQHTLWGGLEE